MSLQENGNYEGWKQQFSIKLNEQQERAVRTAEGSVLLLAVPGSGKTTVLVARLGYLIFCWGILPENILTITYTVAAPRDMKRRFGETFGEAMNGVTLTTTIPVTGTAGERISTTIKAIAVKDTYWNSDQTSKTVDGRVYTVNFKSNGGSSVSKQYVQYNKVIKKPSNPKRSKYTFAGWYTDSKLTKAWDFNTKIKSGKTLYAKWKKISLKQAVISKVQNVSGKKIKVTVKKVSGADGYQIQYSTKSNMKSAKTVTSSKTTTTISKLSKGKKYYVRVKAYKKDSTGKKVAGKWSKVKNLKVSK